MPHESTPGRTLLSSTVPKDRIITTFPHPYNPEATRYQQINFSSRVKEACSQNRTGTVGLKICKAVLVGDVAVGKSCLVNRFCHDVFDRDYKATIGVDFEVEKFSVLSTSFNLQIWDTAGQERFKCIAASYYRGANVVIVVFDLSDVESLAHCATWAKDACSAAQNPLIFLVGAKKDIVSESAYQDVEKEATKMAQQLQAEFWALSSKTGENVKEFFFRAVSLTFDAAVLRELDSSSSGSAKKIGSDMIKIEKDEDVYEKSRSKLACCGTR